MTVASSPCSRAIGSSASSSHSLFERIVSSAPALRNSRRIDRGISALREAVEVLAERHHLLQPVREVLTRVLLAERGNVNGAILDRSEQEVAIELSIVLEVDLFLPPLDLVERRLSDVEVPAAR